MSVYRKTKTGQLVKVAGYNVQKLNDKMFYAVHSYSQDNLTEYYDITAAAEIYMSKFVDYSQFTVYSDVPNTTTNAYLKLDNQLLRIYDENGPVAVGKFDGKLDCYIVQVNDSKVQFVNDLAILTKVDKSSSNNILYGTNGTGQQITLTYGTSGTPNLIVQRDSNSQIVVPQTPTDNSHATSKKYVDDLLTNNAVKYSSAQSLNSTQQAQARTNIGAGTPATLVSVNNVPTYTLAFTSDPQTQINGKQASLDANQLLAVNSGITTTLVTQIGTNQGNISTNTTDISNIKLVIPDDATSLNPLATQGYVTQLMQTMSAHFRGNWADWSTVPTTAASYPIDDDGNRTPTTNDYMVVQDAGDYTLETLVGCWRFKYSGVWATNGKSGWHPEYQINETPLTTEQLAALNSGITASLVTQIGTNQTNIGTIQTTMITNVSFDSQTNKLQKTINSNTTDIVTFGTNAFTSTAIPTSAADLGIVLTTTAGSEAITVGSNTLSIPTTTSSVTQNSTAALTSGGAYTALLDKMNIVNPTGTGSFSMNRLANSTVGTNSATVGNNNTASGDYSTAEGNGTIASGIGSHAEGLGTTAVGLYSHTEGYSSGAAGNYAHAEGYATLAQRVAQHVAGKYNIADTGGTGSTDFGTYVEIIGNGTDISNRSNARTLDWLGNEWIAGRFQAAGGLTDGNNANYELQLPNTTSWTADKIIATTDQIPNPITIVTTSGSQSISDGTNTLSFGSNAFNSTPIPTVNDATLTIQLNGTAVDTFTANASVNKTINVKALPNYSLSIGSTNGGNPRQVLFCSVNYTNFDSNSGAYFKLGAMSGHGNGSSYTFVEDIFINVNYQGTVSCEVYKYVQQGVTLDGVDRNYGDVFYIIDTTNKIVYFYILLGQYSSAQFTPGTKIGAAKEVTSANGIIQYTGTPTYYSSGTKTWAGGDGTTYARKSDIPTFSLSGTTLTITT